MTYDDRDASESSMHAHPMADESIGRFHERLKKAIGSESVRGFARRCGMSEGAVRSYLSTDEAARTYPTLDKLPALAAAAGMSVGELAFGHEPGDIVVGAELDEDEFALIPLYDARCSAGHGSWNEGATVIARLAFTRYSLRKRGLTAEKLSAIQVEGDSMEPLLKAGDTVMVDHSQSAMAADGIYVIRLGQGFYAKRLQREWDGSVVILSTNPAYKPQPVPSDRLEELEIVGRVVWAAEWII